NLTNGDYPGWPAVQTNSMIHTKTLGSVDRSQFLTLSYVYELPFGQGKRFINTTNPVLKQHVGGWQVAGMAQNTAADVITVSTLQVNYAGVGAIWPNRVLGVPIIQTGCASYDPNNPAQNRYLNKTAFADPPLYTFGNTGVLPNVRNCGYFNENLS